MVLWCCGAVMVGWINIIRSIQDCSSDNLVYPSCYSLYFLHSILSIYFPALWSAYWIFCWANKYRISDERVYFLMECVVTTGTVISFTTHVWKGHCPSELKISLENINIILSKIIYKNTQGPELLMLHRQRRIFLKDKIAISNNFKILHWSGDCGQTLRYQFLQIISWIKYFNLSKSDSCWTKEIDYFSRSHIKYKISTESW